MTNDSPRTRRGVSRRWWVAAGGLAVVAVMLVLVLRLGSRPDLDPVRAERVTLYSIDFREEGERLPGTGEAIHDYPVLGKVEVTEIEQRRQLLDALNAAIAERDVVQYKCFWPRHVLRVEQDGQTIDYVICFHCRNYHLYVDGRQRTGFTASIGADAAPVFNKLLDEAKVPVVPPMP